jgi:hypothetical protein
MAAPASNYKIADISLAAYGRRELVIAENEVCLDFIGLYLSVLTFGRCLVLWKSDANTDQISH